MGRQHDQIRPLVLNDPMNDGASFTQFRDGLHMLAGERIEGKFPQPLPLEGSSLFGQSGICDRQLALSQASGP